MKKKKEILWVKRPVKFFSKDDLRESNEKELKEQILKLQKHIVYVEKRLSEAIIYLDDIVEKIDETIKDKKGKR